MDKKVIKSVVNRVCITAILLTGMIVGERLYEYNSVMKRMEARRAEKARAKAEA